MSEEDARRTLHGDELPKEGFRTKNFNEEELNWRCQSGTCGHVTDTRDTAHEYQCGQMVRVDPYTELPIRYEHLTLFERMELEAN